MNVSQVTPVVITAKPTLMDKVLANVDQTLITQGGVFERFSMFGIMATPKMIKLLAQDPNVVSITMDQQLYGFNDEYRLFGPDESVFIGTGASRKYIGADLAEQVGLTGNGVKVAVLDTGVWNLHPQLHLKAGDINAILPFPDIIEDFPKPLPAPPSPIPFTDLLRIKTYKGSPGGPDDNGHGCHCVTTVGGDDVVSPDGIKCKGVAPGSSLLSIKVLGTPAGFGMSTDIIRGIDIALDNGAKVISMSLGSREGDNLTAECQAIRMAMAMYPDVIFCVAAGNFGPERQTLGSPACSIESLTVGSMSILDKQVSYFSSRGPTEDNYIKPDVLAPGGGRSVRPPNGKRDEFIYSGTALGQILDISQDGRPDGYAALHGTSMATPHVAGLMAILKQMDPSITTNRVIQIMAQGKQKDVNVGYGPIHFNMFGVNK